MMPPGGDVRPPAAEATDMAIPWLESFKPAASRRTHLLLAAVLWTVVGGLLAYFGTCWLLQASIAHVYLLLAAAGGAGVIKARFVLGKTAARTVERIRLRGEGRCLGGFVSFRTWALIALMVAAGRLLRGGWLAQPIVGFIYAAIGTGLVLSATRFWRAWYRQSG